MLAACGSAAPSGPAEPTVLRIGVPEAGIAAPDIGLPQIARFFSVEGLTTKGRDGRAIPSLAKSWNATEDGLTWRFVLRDDVTFHDGTPLTAALARESLLASLARPNTKTMYPGLADVVDLTAAAEHELVITLRRRSAFLIDDLEFPITRAGPQGAAVGTGAFKTTQSSRDEIVMAAHTGYHQGRPHIDQVIIKAYPALRTAWASLMRQEIDVLSDVAHDAAEFVGATDVAMHSFPRNYVYLIAFNSARPKLASSPLRRALNAAIDRPQLIQNMLKGRGLAASGPLSPHNWAYDSELPGYTYDPSLAATTLDAAGLRRPPLRPGTIPARLSFVCLVPQNHSILERLALGVQKQLYEIGVDMQLQSVSAEEYNVRIREGDFEAVIIDLIGGPGLGRAYMFWRSPNGVKGLNVFGYRNPEADRWFDALRYAASDTEFRAAASQLQRTLLEDPPALFLAWNERTRAISRRFTFPADARTDPFRLLWRWSPRQADSSLTTP